MLNDPLFVLDAGPAWAEQASNEPGSYSLLSKKFRASATVSGQTVKEGADHEAIAARLLEVRSTAEKDVMKQSGREVSVTTSSKELPFGVQIEYFGHDSSGRIFRYWAVVAPTKVVNIYLETYGQSEEGLSQIFRELLKGLRL